MRRLSLSLSHVCASRPRRLCEMPFVFKTFSEYNERDDAVMPILCKCDPLPMSVLK